MDPLYGGVQKNLSRQCAMRDVGKFSILWLGRGRMRNAKCLKMPVDRASSGIEGGDWLRGLQ
jgi:hypothetical protein